LKQWRDKSDGKAKTTFRARAGAAPLKRETGLDCLGKGGSIPRPRGRGPVEAELTVSDMSARASIPRPRGRGPVEAGGFCCCCGC